MLAAAAILVAGCRDDSGQHLLPSTGVAQAGVPVVTSDLRAGAVPPDRTAENPYVDDEHALAAGRELYGTMNCAGCHGPEGGGGIGPPFADADWIYGGAPENIVQSVLQGRPNGMPAFGGKLPAAEAWKIAAYVKHLAMPAEKKAGTASGPPGSARGNTAVGGRQ